MKLKDLIHQKSYEQIIRQVRRSPITLVPTILGFGLLLALPIVVQWLMLRLFPNFLNLPVIFPLAILFTSVYYLTINLFFYTYFVDFYLDVLVLTNDRIISIKQLGLFSRQILEVDLYQIHDATSDSNGTFASLFNYGNLHIETAGAEPKLIGQNIPAPHALRRELLDLASVDQRYHNK